MSGMLTSGYLVFWDFRSFAARSVLPSPCSFAAFDMLCEALGWGPPDRSIVVCVCPLPFSPMPEGCSGWDWLDGESGMTVPECGSTLPVGVFLSKSLDRPDGVVIGDCDVPPSSAFTCPLSARMAPPAMRPEKTRHEHRFIWWFLLFVKSDTQARPCYEQNSCANG